MANEVEMSARLYASKGGAVINSQSYSTVANMTGTDMGQQTQVVGTTDEALDLTADLATPYRLLVVNLDLVNSVSIGPSSPYSFQIPAGQFILIPWVDATMYVKASNSPVKIFAQFCEL
jgi:hypothetical protein